MIDEARFEFESKTPAIRAIEESTIKECESVLRELEIEMQCIESLKLCKDPISNHVQELKRTAIDLRDEEDNMSERIWNIRIELQQITALTPSVNARTQGA